MTVPYRLGTRLLDGRPTAAVAVGDHAYRLSDILGADAPASVLTVLGGWERWREAITGQVATGRHDGVAPIPEETPFLPPVPTPPKVICIGVNYHDHVREMGMTTLPEFPYAFLRPATCLAGHGEPVPLPDWPLFVDWEAELGVVIGRRCRAVRGGAALAAVAGYTIVNDISARDWIESRPPVGIDWVMQKGWDAFQPTGPWLTPAAFVPDPGALEIGLSVNGETKQSSSTGQMIFSVQAIVEHLSAIMTLEPGDVIATGTPAGVGFGAKPRQRLQAGDLVRVTIAGLGTLENRVG